LYENWCRAKLQLHHPYTGAVETLQRVDWEDIGWSAAYANCVLTYWLVVARIDFKAEININRLDRISLKREKLFPIFLDRASIATDIPEEIPNVDITDLVDNQQRIFLRVVEHYQSTLAGEHPPPLRINIDGTALQKKFRIFFYRKWAVLYTRSWPPPINSDQWVGAADISGWETGRENPLLQTILVILQFE
jgi:hypothetical protein